MNVYKIVAFLKGPGGVVEAPLATPITADTMKEALQASINLIEWPSEPVKVIGLQITSSEIGIK